MGKKSAKRKTAPDAVAVAEREAGRETAKAQRQDAKKQRRSDRQKEADPTTLHANDLPRVTKYTNKQRTLVFSSRGISHRDRHMMQDIRDLLPHSKKDVKFDCKNDLLAVNEVCEMKNCNNCLFFETRKHTDLYMWLARAPNGPSIKFLVQNVHTLSELRLTGNCLKGSRPLLSFDKAFDESPHLRLMKELFTQALGSPRGHPRTKPFVDHVFGFYLVDGRIWFRNFQIVYDAQPNPKNDNKADPVLVEIGPRFVLQPIKIFDGSFQGATLWENPDYVSPNKLRASFRKERGNDYKQRKEQEGSRKTVLENAKLAKDAVAAIFENQGGALPGSESEDEE